MFSQGPPTLREATQEDFSFLTLMLVEATNWDGLRKTTPASVEQDANSWRYLDGWMRPGDFGIMAVDGTVPVGAAWARFFTSADAGYGYVSDDIPELTLAVAPGARGRGVGRAVLEGLLRGALDRRIAGVSLSVEDGNLAARTLYESEGFEVVGRVGNSDTMLLRLAPA